MTDAHDTGREVIGIAELLQQHLPEPVKLVLFTSSSAPTSRDQQQLLEEIVKLSSRLSLAVYDLDANQDLGRAYDVDKAPCTAIIGARDYGMRFYGVTAGHELSTLLEGMLLASNGRSGLGPALEAWVGRIGTSTRIEVFVTLTCPYCPRVVHVAYQMAIANDHVRADVVEVAEFPELARARGLGGVPLVVVNGRHAFHGLRSPEEVILEVLRIVSPDVFEEVETDLRSRAGERRVQAPVPGHVYDVLVVGAGPAAMSAAVYAVRKGLDLLLLGDRLGGQVADTETVENWLGVERIGGHDLAIMFRAHLEHYRLAEAFQVRVAAVERRGDVFVARVADGPEYRARAVIYCAGKQYRTLGVPGETRFLGHGIAFCATCDAPLFRGKRVVVIGGGNSAFTAARDLIPYAAEIHLVNVMPDWQADAILQSTISGNPKVRLHAATSVTEFLGERDLTGVRLASAEAGEPQELPADGVFLEIGLTPNSGPVAELAALNPQGEIVVNRDQSTSVPGFFAAGDVTDEPEKQIVVAEGAGAKAGLAAFNYLVATGGLNRRETARKGEGRQT